MSSAATVARILMGAAFFVFGLNGFLHFLPNPDPPPKAAEFLKALEATRYMIPLISGTQVLVGALLVTGVAVPLALVMAAPLLVNIVAFHVFILPAGIAPGLVLTACELVLARACWSRLRPLFT